MEPILTADEHDLRHFQACLMVETLHNFVDKMDVGTEAEGQKLLVLAGLYGLLECLQRLTPANIVALEGVADSHFYNGILPTQ